MDHSAAMLGTMRTERTTLRRRPGRGSHDLATISAILDEALVCHLGFSVDEQPYVIPTIHARLGERLYVHGAVANRMLDVLRSGATCCVTATLLDGLVLARSAFHHSVNYRSVVVLGRASGVDDLAEKEAALTAIVEKVMRGRAAACRPPSEAELRATNVVWLPLDEASAKVRSGPPIDDDADYALPHWAGVIPLRISAGAPEPDPRLDLRTPYPHAVIARG
jgi:uncharacterized protein